MSSKVLTRNQALWAEFLPEGHFSITYGPACLATLPDAISHWDNVYPERGQDFKKLWQDPQYRSILQELGKGKSLQDSSLDSSSQLLLFKDWVVVPNDPKIQLRTLQNCHDSSLAGPLGQEKTLKLVKRDLHWSGMPQFIKDYVLYCQQCSGNKNIHHKRFGLLKPLPIPNVDRFSKMAVFIPTMSSITSLDLAHLLIKNIFSKHGLPSSIQLKISRDLSTAYHPETDGQTERVNHILEQYLWMYVSYHQDDWNTWLPLAEFAYNNSDHSSTKQSPFFTVYGRDPHFDSVHITQDTPAGNLSTKIQSVQKDVKRELEVSINQFKRYADKSRASPPVLNPGDMKVSTQASISMEIHPPSLPYFTFGTSQDINNPKSASRASSSNHHLRRRGMGSLLNTGFKAQEKKVMVSGGMERFQ
ncbi:hypothetical protein O181_103812 [Austropuccinia psidii MF-1]|uniref:Integrase catalytic domain-containing protein n=1 Tax=Austropuccinia psidii MF-1 TaxID=1389203 RepID=A0A9Q3PKT7_9BASI|nr:hypothetical protein [Austropuccinia psidii MF-1]